MSNQGYKATFNHYRCMYVIVDSTVRLTYQLASIKTHFCVALVILSIAIFNAK